MQQSVISPVSLKRADWEQVSDLVGNQSDGIVTNVGANEGSERKVKLNKVGRHESSLEFGGLVKTSLEFGARRGTSLDFDGQAAVGVNGTSSRRMNSGTDEQGGQQQDAVQGSRKPTMSGTDLETKDIATSSLEHA